MPQRSKRELLKDALALAACAIIGLAWAWLAVRDLDKDVARDCGYVAVEGLAPWCPAWWQDQGIEIPESVQKAYAEAEDSK